MKLPLTMFLFLLLAGHAAAEQLADTPWPEALKELALQRYEDRLKGAEEKLKRLEENVAQAPDDRQHMHPLLEDLKSVSKETEKLLKDASKVPAHEWRQIEPVIDLTLSQVEDVFEFATEEVSAPADAAAMMAAESKEDADEHISDLHDSAAETTGEANIRVLAEIDQWEKLRQKIDSLEKNLSGRKE
jgi:ElaB/YqjD/DUF883 family membrane-anchored ribosome-binding protein